MAESRQVVVRKEGQETCAHHKGRTLEYFCEKCQEMACAKCVTTVHRGHVMSELSDIVVTIKEDIRGFIEDTEENKLPQSKKNIQSTINELKTNAEYFENLSTEATNQADRLKQEIDLMTAETLSFYLELKEGNAQLLTKYKRELEEGHIELRKKTQECKRLLQTASDITLFDARDKIKKFGFKSSDKPTLRSASFNPTKSYRGFLEQAFSTRTMSCESKYTLLPKAKILGESETEDDANAVSCCQSQEETYVCYFFGLHSELHRLDKELKKQHSITMDLDITDISIARETNHIWAACSDNDSIIEIASGSPITRFYLEKKPKSLCVTKDNHVLVGMIGYVAKFSMTGEVVLTTETVDTQIKCVIYNPFKIRECLVTSNVAVVDLQKRANKVLVLDKDLRLLFCCSGDIQEGQHHERTSSKPRNVAFDSVGNIVIDDSMNGHIHLLDGNGQFLRIIHTNSYPVSVFDIDNNNILWMAYYNGDNYNGVVARLQYCTC